MTVADKTRVRSNGLLAVWIVLAPACFVGGCDKSKKQSGAPSASTQASSSAPATVASSSASSAAPAPSSSAPASVPKLPGTSKGCPDDMVRVEGEYCPGVVQPCIEHHEEYKRSKGDKNVSERCLRYEPSRCASKKKKQLSFCVDRFEYPNKQGELPLVLVSWRQAKKRCEDIGKRLCTEEEFNFACEGPEMNPYVNGLIRDQKKCHIDAPYVRPDHSRRMYHYEKCMENERCKAEMERLDKRHKIGSRLTCVSWAGAVDMNGNVNEWVALPGKEPPNRSGLKGGWWGPVRNRCRPTVTFHKEEDYGYEAGFRCCKDASDGTD